MTDYLKAYQEYYRVRMERYENDTDFPDSYHSEKAIYEAIAGCGELGDFKERLGNLNELNAVAYVRDKQRIYHKHYESMQETVRAQTPRRIIEKAPQYEKVLDLIEMVNNEEARGMNEINADSVSPFDNWVLLEHHEVYSTAEVPSAYKSKYQNYAQEDITESKVRLKDAEDNLNLYVPGWKFNKELPKEFRHRRKFPVSDSAFDERLKQFIQFTNL
jgi:hypothetical protein